MCFDGVCVGGLCLATCRQLPLQDAVSSHSSDCRLAAVQSGQHAHTEETQTPRKTSCSHSEPEIFLPFLTLSNTPCSPHFNTLTLNTDQNKMASEVGICGSTKLTEKL